MNVTLTVVRGGTVTVTLALRSRVSARVDIGASKLVTGAGLVSRQNIKEQIKFVRSLRWLCFYTCLSVILLTGKGVCIGKGLHPGPLHPGRGCLHPGGVCIQRGLHLGGVEQTSPIGYSGIRSTSGRCASYWNAFLLAAYNF